MLFYALCILGMVVILESKAAGLCLQLKSDNSFVFFFLYKQSIGSIWKNRKRYVSFIICAPHTKPRFSRTVEEKTSYDSFSAPRFEEWEDMKSNNGRSWHVHVKQDFSFDLCLWFVPTLFNVTCECRFEWN